MAITWTPVPALMFPAQVVAPWRLAAFDLGAATHVRILATGSWSIAPGVIEACGPDGWLGLAIRPEALLLGTAPPGALLAKFGGSTASVGAAPAGSEPGDAPLLVGASAVLPLKSDGSGPLLVGINQLLGVRPRIYAISLQIDIALP